jgi:hypothetical protein
MKMKQHYRFQSEAPSPAHQNQDGGRKGARVMSQNPHQAPADPANKYSTQQQFLIN